MLGDLGSDDIERAAVLAVGGATKNSGQRCTAVKRILVDDSIADAFVARVLHHAKAIRFGDPMDPETDLGTVIDAPTAEMFERRVADAAKDGAKVLYNPGRKAALFPPVVIDHVNPRSELVLEETFGPVFRLSAAAASITSSKPPTVPHLASRRASAPTARSRDALYR